MSNASPEPRKDAFDELDSALSRAGDVAGEDDECVPPAGTTRRNVLLSTLFGMAVILLAAVVGYTSSVVAVNRAAKHTDNRVAVLERDLQQRRSAAAEQNANRDAQIGELRRLVCVFADHAQPRDRTIEEIRSRYDCVLPTPSVSPTPSSR